MPEWPAVPFRDVLLSPIRSGINAPTRVRGEGVPLINMRELFRYDRIGDIDMELAPVPQGDQATYLVDEGDLLFARQSLKVEGAGKCAIVQRADRPRTWEGHILRARPDRATADPRFLYYWFRSPQGRAATASIVEQVAAAGIRGSDLAQLPVPVPELREQTAIADTLWALDDKSESNAQVAALAEELLATHAEAMGSNAMVPLGALAFCDREMILPSRFVSDLIDHYSIPAFDAARVADRCRGQTVMSGKFVVQGPSILVSRLNPRVPRIWYAVPSDRPAFCSTEFLVMRPRPPLSLGDIWLACSDPYFFAEMAQRATGTSGSHQRIRPQDALSIEVPDPRQVDRAVRAEADLLLRLAHQRRQESRTLAELRDALLPELLSGRRRVPEAEELVESVT